MFTFQPCDLLGVSALECLNFFSRGGEFLGRLGMIGLDVLHVCLELINLAGEFLSQRIRRFFRLAELASSLRKLFLDFNQRGLMLSLELIDLLGMLFLEFLG